MRPLALSISCVRAVSRMMPIDPLFSRSLRHTAQAVELAGHHDVKQRHIDVAVLALINPERLVPRTGLERVVAGALEVDDDKFADGLLVLRDKNFFSYSTLPSGAGRPAFPPCGAAVIPA